MAAKRTPEDTTPPVIQPVDLTYRLPQHHIKTLRDIFRGTEESKAGIKTRYIPDATPRQVQPTRNQFGLTSKPVLLDSYRFRSDDDEEDKDIELNDLERFVERTGGFRKSPWRKEIRRAREAIERLRLAGDHKSVGVLAVTYGYADPSVRQWPQDIQRQLGELASLIRYTDQTELHRLALARAIALCNTPEGVISIRVLEIDAYERERLSSGDALAAIYDLHPEPKPIRREAESIEHWEARRTPRPPIQMREDDHTFAVRLARWTHQRDMAKHRALDFTIAAKAEAELMLVEASHRYVNAWYDVHS